jgi:hypothetical protein
MTCAGARQGARSSNHSFELCPTPRPCARAIDGGLRSGRLDTPIRNEKVGDKFLSVRCRFDPRRTRRIVVLLPQPRTSEARVGASSSANAEAEAEAEAMQGYGANCSPGIGTAVGNVRTHATAAASRRAMRLRAMKQPPCSAAAGRRATPLRCGTRRSRSRVHPAIAAERLSRRCGAVHACVRHGHRAAGRATRSDPESAAAG